MPSYEKFKAIIELLRLRPIDVAKGTGITPTVFSDWKSGKSKPKIDKLIAIATFLKVTVGELLE